MWCGLDLKYEYPGESEAMGSGCEEGKKAARDGCPIARLTQLIIGPQIVPGSGIKENMPTFEGEASGAHVTPFRGDRDR